jgi:D-alanyl-D-alanine carboxypeptidase
MIKHSRYHQVDSAIMYGLAIIAVIFLANIKNIPHKVGVISTPFHEDSVALPMFNQEAFSKVKIQGEAYVVYDIVDQKVIAGKNENLVLPLASVTKVMTLITARTHYAGNKHITITPQSIDEGYDLGLRKNQIFDLDELLKYTLVFSSNDGAQAIADTLGGRSVFISQMNKDAENFGLPLVFTHPAGLDEKGKIGGLGSALSVAKMIAIARREFPEILEATTKTRVTVLSSTGKITGVPNTNQEVPDFLGIEASKTGFTDLAGGNLVIIVDVALGHPVAIVVLHSTHEERFSDIQILYKALQNSIQK